MAVTYRGMIDDASATPNTDLLVRDIETTLHFVEWNQAMLQRMLRMGSKPTDHKFTWLADYDDEPSAVAAVSEGALFSGITASPGEPTVLGNGIHYWSTAFALSDLSREFTSVYGDQWDYQEARKYRLAVKQMDVNLLHSTYAAGDSYSTATPPSTAPQTCGLVRWALTSGSRAANAADSIAGLSVPVTLCATGQQQPTGSPVTDTVFNTFLQSMKNNGADISRLVCMTGLAGKTRASSFLRVYDTGSSTAQPLYQYTRNLGDKTAGQVVDWYESDWGTIGFAVNKYMSSTYTQSVNPTGSAGDFSFAGNDAYLFFDPTTVMIRPVTSYNVKRMATSGLSESAMLSVAMGLQVNNPRDLGLICNIDGS